MKLSIDPTKLIDRLGLNVELKLFDNLVVMREPDLACVEVSVKTNFYRDHKLAAKNPHQPDP